MVVNGKLETPSGGGERRRRRAGRWPIASATSSVVSIGVWGAQGEIVTRVHGEEMHEVVQRLRQAHEGGERAGAKIEQTASPAPPHRKRQRRGRKASSAAVDATSMPMPVIPALR